MAGIKQSYGDVAGLVQLLAISNSCPWREVPLAVLGAAFDASADKTKNWLSVGGFISSSADWEDFDRVWRERLSKDGLSYFHMVDFAHSVEEFADGWKGNEPRRQRLLMDL